ncbi:MFS general substrate transporter [Ceraceosorus guamensis]|uniref:MFS general substrate transporter n=1 Tax=Ceraceosorus guamensis TaxID=1522189 RepID=A0A316VMF4_9BASI|nr:MFS general substrate transporter [Ceraceosorus guamensis]PWN38762.1 MFS general substrate transporter [Ceraceosorus guamensis]
MSRQEPHAPIAEIEANAPSYDYNEASKQHNHHHDHDTPSKSAGSHSDDDGSLHSRDAREEIVAEEGAQGVARAEAFTRLLRSHKRGKALLWLLGILIWCTMFVYALDNGLTGNIFTPIIGSLYGRHAQISAVTTASSIIAAVSKPFLGKISDYTSRPFTYSITLCFYCVGFIVAATSETWAAYIIGLCFTSFAKAGIDLLGDIIISDLTPLQWRQFFTSGLTSPYFITAYIGGFIVDGLGITDADYGQWRWALGMFCILMPAFLGPVIVLLFALQRQAAQLGMISMGASGIKRRGQESTTRGQTTWQIIVAASISMDLVGLLLFAFGFGLLLLPFSLAKGAQGGWSNPSMIAMVVVGFVLLVIFALWEQYGAPVPLAPRRVLRNRAFLVAVLIDFLAQFGSFVASIYFSSYIYVTQDLTDYQWTALTATTTVGLCFFGILNGLLQRRFHRFKAQMLFGSVAKLIGYGICMTAGNRATTNLAALAISRILIAMSGMMVGGARLASQCAVAHRDLVTTIYTVSLISSVGSSVGSSVCASIWQNRMLTYMREEIPATVPDATIRKVYASIKTLRSYPLDDPIRIGGIAAYQRVQGIMFIVAIVVSAAGVIITFFVPNYYLGTQHNHVSKRDLDGNDVGGPVVRDTSNEAPPTTSGQKAWRAIRDAWDFPPRKPLAA